MVAAAAALMGPVAYLDIAYGLHGGDKPLTDYMFQVSQAGSQAVVWLWLVGYGGRSTRPSLDRGGPSKPFTHFTYPSLFNLKKKQTGPLGVGAPLIAYVVFKFLVTTLSVSLPLPVGLFTPTFVTGGAIGRLFGEIVHVRTHARTRILFPPPPCFMHARAFCFRPPPPCCLCVYVICVYVYVFHQPPSRRFLGVKACVMLCGLVH